MPAKKTILVADDEPAVRLLISETLEGADFHVLEAGDGHEIMALLNCMCPDLIVLDVIMPGPNGYDICRYIRSDPKFQRLPVIFLTARTEAYGRTTGMAVGGDAYLTKPFRPSDLLKVIDHLLADNL
jgi:twitching motility two-component system response regulator PilH